MIFHSETREKVNISTWTHKSCFESASCKSYLFNVHSEAVFLITFFRCTQEEGLDCQHTIMPRKLTCRRADWPPTHLQPGCNSANEAKWNSFLQLNPHCLLIESLLVPLSSTYHDASVIIPRNPCTWPFLPSKILYSGAHLLLKLK